MEGLQLQAWITAVFDEHAEELLRWLQARTASREVAADLCAETFAIALEQHRSFDPDRGEVGGWLWGIARNLFRQYLRTAQVERRARERLAIHTPRVTHDEIGDVDDRLDAQLRIGDLDELLDGLGPSVAAAVRLRVIDRLPYDTIAQRCGCSVGAARVRVSRGLAALLGDVEDPGRDEVLT
jgi:RNA polymerase sigma-70 factor (ECF subfamily)